MKVELIPSTVGETKPHQYCTSVVIDDALALDAGTLGLLSPFSRQQAIKQLFISHCHIDHIATLPTFLDNIFDPDTECVEVYANETTIECLRDDVFNDRLWPDFISLSETGPAFLKLHTIQSEQTIAAGKYSVTPILLHHNIPTFGFVVDGPEGSVAFASDTSPTERLWEVLRERPNLKAVFLECSFPNSHAWLADEACHLCPQLFEGELAKLDKDVSVYAFHVKPAFFDEIGRELKQLDRGNIHIAAPGHVYDF